MRAFFNLAQRERGPQFFMTRLSLSSAVAESLRARAEQAYPLECCGVLLGLPLGPEGDWRVAEAVALANAETAMPGSRYSIAPEALVRTLREARERGLELAGFYHSHPDHPAQWSQTDLAEAHWLGLSYVITAVERGRAGETRAFLLAGSSEEDKHFEEQELFLASSC